MLGGPRPHGGGSDGGKEKRFQGPAGDFGNTKSQSNIKSLQIMSKNSANLLDQKCEMDAYAVMQFCRLA